MVRFASVFPLTFGTLSVLVSSLALASGVRGDGGVHAGDAGDDGARSKAVLHVKDRVVTVADLEDKLATVPRYQLVSFGDNPDAIRRRFLEGVILPELLAGIGAEDKKVTRDLAVRTRLDRVFANATARAIRATLPPASSIPMAEVTAAYEARRQELETPERIALFRILCKTEVEANDVLAAAKKDGTFETWKGLARDHSLDKATYLRAGTLGFVGPDDRSNEPGLKVDHAVVAAALLVKDGAFVPTPVREGDGFAVVWRRGSLPGASHPLAEVEAEIRESLARQRGEQAVKARMAELRKARVTARDTTPLDTLELPPVDVGLFGGGVAAGRDGGADR